MSAFDQVKKWMKNELTVTFPGWAWALGAVLILVFLLD
jgi:hypothetical protein